MDFSVLYAIQNIHCAWLDTLVLWITKLAGDYGQLWVCVGVLLCIFKKTRRSGITMLLSYGLVFLVGQYGLKDLIARPRPCHIDETVELLVKRPSSYSCPSTHSAWAFAAAASVFAYHKKAGTAVFLIAAVIGFTRLYLFVHFPTDVLFGAALGILLGLLTAAAVRFAEKKIRSAVRKKKKEAK